jgi:hypothetical protein
MTSGVDPFDTTGLRAAVLGAWEASPTRFREDANVEEDLRLDGYADAWFVELAQNAADAARSAGLPGRIRVRLDGGELRVANTGAPLTAAGVAALTSLRASAKRDDAGSVGRFGVGFTAVLAVSDAPRLVSTGGGVAFSVARTAAAVAPLPGPAAELARRDEPPVLRLAWAVAEEPPAGFTTEVRLPLRAGVDGAALLDQARAGAADLLLALPDLAAIEVAGALTERMDRPGEVLVAERRWRVVRRGGSLAATDAHTQAVEQRGRRDWTVCWALPLTATGEPDPLTEDVLHAPTATGERLGLPARLIAGLPLEPDRRRVRAGVATDQVLAGAAVAYLDLVRATPPGHRLALVPPAGFPRSELDGRLRELLLDALRGAAWLPAAAATGEGPDGGADAPNTGSAGGTDGRAGRGSGRPEPAPAPAEPAAAAPAPAAPAPAAPAPAAPAPAAPAPAAPAPAAPTPAEPAPAELVPARAEWLDLPGAGPGLHRLLAAAGFTRLLAPLPPAAAAQLAELGVHRLGPAELVSRLLEVQRQPGWWRALYAELESPAETVPGLRDELRALPVPLADGRTVAGPAGVLLPAGPDDPGAVARLAALALPGLHLGHPGAGHPLLARLGAEPADPAALLEHPALLAAVDRALDVAEAGLDPEPLADAVLALVTELGAAPAGGLGALALPDTDGHPTRADELMLPDAVLRPLLAADTPLGVLDPGWADRYPRGSWTAVGVLDGFAVLVEEDPAGPDHDLDDEERWWDELPAPPSRLLAVRDLDLVDDGRWPAALAVLAGDRDTRAAVTESGSYTSWWLRRHARIGGQPPTHYRLPSAGRLAALYEPVPAGDLDEQFLTAIGARADLTVPDPAAAADLLTRLADPVRSPDPALVADAHAALAAAVTAGRIDVEEVAVPQRVRTLDGAVADVDDALVLDAPWLAAVLPAHELVFGGDPVALAELLDLPLATEVVAGEVEGAEVEEGSRVVEWAELPEVVVAGRRLGLSLPEGGVRLHEQLWVRLSRPVEGRFRVPAWPDRNGGWHAEDPLRALLAAAGSDGP